MNETRNSLRGSRELCWSGKTGVHPIGPLSFLLITSTNENEVKGRGQDGGVL